ncbi:MAG: DMT family transporter [Vibrio sp.]
MNIILAMIPAFLWGTTYSATQFTLDGWPPLLLGVLRALPAGLLLLLIKPSLPTKASWKPLLLIGTINIGVFFCCIFVMAQTLPSAISSVGMMGVPVVAMLIHWIVNGVKPSALKVLCGIGLLVFAWQLFNPSSIQLNGMGLLAMALAMLCLIIGSLLTQKIGKNVHWWTVVTWQLLFGGMVLIPVTLIHASMHTDAYVQVISAFSWKNMMGLVWVSGFNTALGYGLYVWLIQRMSIVDFTFGGIANPIAGISCGLVLLNESYTPEQFIIMLAMIFTSLLPQIIHARQQAKQSLQPQ